MKNAIFSREESTDFKSAPAIGGKKGEKEKKGKIFTDFDDVDR